jgi:hypothetical protein
VFVTNFLGVLIDEKLNWKEHINMVKSKVSKSIAIIYKASRYLDKNSLITLYCSLFLPYISYCSEVWGNTYKTNIQQKKMMRIICKADRRAHTNPLFYKLNVLKLYDLIELKTATVMYKARYGQLPTNVQALFKIGTDRYYSTRQVNKFKQSYVRTKLKSMCISVQGVKLWNSLDCSLTNAKHIHVFKKLFKQKLIESYKVTE